MLNFLLILFGLISTNRNVDKATENLQNNSITSEIVNPVDTGGDTGPILPPKK